MSILIKVMTFCVSKDCLQQEECQRHISKCNVRNSTLVNMADFGEICNNCGAAMRETEEDNNDG